MKVREARGGGGALPSGRNISNEVLLGYDNAMPGMLVPLPPQCFLSTLLLRLLGFPPNVVYQQPLSQRTMTTSLVSLHKAGLAGRYGASAL